MKSSAVNFIRAAIFGALMAGFSTAICQERTESTVAFFDVPDLPARIDEPKLRKDADGYALSCAVANRSSETLLGIRLMMIVDRGGRLQRQITWNEPSRVPAYSIKTFVFHPPINKDFPDTDRSFLAIDEVTGHETIWKAEEADKALRAYAHGQHNVIPTVRTVANKFDPRPIVKPAIPLPEENRH